MSIFIHYSHVCIHYIFTHFMYSLYSHIFIIMYIILLYTNISYRSRWNSKRRNDGFPWRRHVNVTSHKTRLLLQCAVHATHKIFYIPMSAVVHILNIFRVYNIMYIGRILGCKHFNFKANR